MAKPDVQEQLNLPGGDPVPAHTVGRLRLVAATDREAVGYATANNQSIAGVHTATPSSTGLLTFADVNPNSGSSNDVIDSPSGTVWEYQLVVPGRKVVTRYLAVTDVAGPLWVPDILAVSPTSIPDSSTEVYVAAQVNTLLSNGTALTGLPGPDAVLDSDDGLLGYEDGTPVIATPTYLATIVDTAGAVMNSDYDANTVLAATTDNTPAALTMAASTILARLASGDIKAATTTEIKTLLAIANSDVSGLGTISTAAATDYAKLAFGTTNQVFSNTTGRRIAVENFDGGLGATDVRLALYADSDDTEPLFYLGTVFGGLGVGFKFGPGGSTATDASIGRNRQGVITLTTPNALTGMAPAGSISSGVSITAVGNVGTGKDTLHTYTILGSLMREDKDQVRAEFFGTAANNGNAKTLTAQYNGVDLLAVSLPTSEAVSWWCEIVIVRTGATTQDICARITYNTSTQVAVTTGSATLSGGTVVRMTGEATSNNDIVSEHMRVSYEPGL